MKYGLWVGNYNFGLQSNYSINLIMQKLLVCKEILEVNGLNYTWYCEMKYKLIHLNKDAFVVFLSSILINNYFILCAFVERFGFHFKTIFSKITSTPRSNFGRHCILIEILQVYHGKRSKKITNLNLGFIFHLLRYITDLS